MKGDWCVLLLRLRSRWKLFKVAWKQQRRLVRVSVTAGISYEHTKRLFDAGWTEEGIYYARIRNDLPGFDL